LKEKNLLKKISGGGGSKFATILGKKGEGVLGQGGGRPKRGFQQVMGGKGCQKKGPKWGGGTKGILKTKFTNQKGEVMEKCSKGGSVEVVAKKKI